LTNPRVFVNPKSGSIRLTGTVDLVDSEGNVIETIENPKFCGCGYSKDKPWCDGSHKKITKPVQTLEEARTSKVAIDPFNPETAVALQIREKLVNARIENEEVIIGLKIGGALESKENQTGVMIYGFLTDAMNVEKGLDTTQYIYPRAEAEVVFKISKDISAPITLDQVLEHVDQVAVGIEIFDYRYGQAQIYSNDAIADNAGAAAFAIGEWVTASQTVFENLHTNLVCNSETIESAPLSAIRGNPWEAIVQLSTLASAQGLIVKKDWVIFSGSATKGVPMTAGNTYAVDTPGLGVVTVLAQ
jgi:2-oxopent-4-enoate/cis-2-oxohex-4-enoate hydratase